MGTLIKLPENELLPIALLLQLILHRQLGESAGQALNCPSDKLSWKCSEQNFTLMSVGITSCSASSALDVPLTPFLVEMRTISAFLCQCASSTVKWCKSSCTIIRYALTFSYILITTTMFLARTLIKINFQNAFTKN